MAEYENEYVVEPLESYNHMYPMSHQDTFHTYTYCGVQAGNTIEHHTFGDVTIFMNETSPLNEFVQREPEKRYIIIADQWSGQRLKVYLPEIPIEEARMRHLATGGKVE